MLKNPPKIIIIGSEIEASIRASFSTVFRSIIVGNNKETGGVAYEFLVGYIKGYSIWNRCGSQGSSDPRTIVNEGTETFTERLKWIRNTLTNDP